MSADAAQAVAPAAGPAGGEPGPAPAPPPIGERFRPGLLGVDEAVGDRRGYTHAAWTLATIMRSLVRDALAEADGPISVTMIGCPEPWLGAQILDWGAERVLSLDPDAARRRAPRRVARAARPEHRPLVGRLRPPRRARPPTRSTAAATSRCSTRAGLDWDEEETIGLLAQARPLRDRHGDPASAYAAATRLAIEQISEAPIPADAERRFVTREVVVLGGRRSR